MKIKCIKADYLDKHLFKANETKPIEGLTLGKVYEAQAVGLSSGSVTSGMGTIYSKVRFLIFNDNGEWDTYQPELFEPRAE